MLNEMHLTAQKGTIDKSEFVGQFQPRYLFLVQFAKIPHSPFGE